jgi:hypothetical protein
MSSLRISRIKHAADEHPGTTGVPGAIRGKAPPAYRPRADYSWTMSLMMWVGADPRRVRWDKACPPQSPMESNRRPARTGWVEEARP